MDYEKLKKRIAELEAENLILKSILDQAGISYSIPNTLHAFDTEKKNENKKENKRENQKAPIEFKQQEEHTISIVPTEITYRHVQKFFSYFWGRMDVFSRRYQNKTTGKTGYFPQCDNFWRSGVCPKRSNKKAKCKECTCRAWTKLEAKYIETHLRGERMDGSDVIGIYPLFPDGTCRFLVFDFDNHSDGAEECDFANMDDSWKEEVESLRKICNIYEIPFLVERSRSGKGAHVWIFFDSPISAASARQFGFSLLNKGAESVNLKSFRFYDRMLPAQSELSRNELGNLIALPLQGQALKEASCIIQI